MYINDNIDLVELHDSEDELQVSKETPFNFTSYKSTVFIVGILETLLADISKETFNASLVQHQDLFVAFEFSAKKTHLFAYKISNRYNQIIMPSY